MYVQCEAFLEYSKPFMNKIIPYVLSNNNLVRKVLLSTNLDFVLGANMFVSVVKKHLKSVGEQM